MITISIRIMRPILMMGLTKMTQEECAEWDSTNNIFSEAERLVDQWTNGNLKAVADRIRHMGAPEAAATVLSAYRIMEFDGPEEQNRFAAFTKRVAEGYYTSDESNDKSDD